MNLNTPSSYYTFCAIVIWANFTEGGKNKPQPSKDKKNRPDFTIKKLHPIAENKFKIWVLNQPERPNSEKLIYEYKFLPERNYDRYRQIRVLNQSDSPNNQKSEREYERSQKTEHFKRTMTIGFRFVVIQIHYNNPENRFKIKTELSNGQRALNMTLVNKNYRHSLREKRKHRSSFRSEQKSFQPSYVYQAKTVIQPKVADGQIPIKARLPHINFKHLMQIAN